MLGTINLFGPDGYEQFIHPLLKILRNINDYATDYYYYMTPCPWLQIKIYQILQVLPVPRDRSTIEDIDSLVKKTFNQTEVTKHVNKNNSDHSILFEAIKLTMSMGAHASIENVRSSILLLVKFTGVKEPNIRYIALECLSKAQPYHL